MEEGKHLCVCALVPFTNDKSCKNGRARSVIPTDPHGWAPQRAGWPFSAHHKLKGILKHFSSSPDTRLWIMGATWVSDTPQCCGGVASPQLADRPAVWQVSEGLNWDDKSRNKDEMDWVGFPLLALFNFLNSYDLRVCVSLWTFFLE